MHLPALIRHTGSPANREHPGKAHNTVEERANGPAAIYNAEGTCAGCMILQQVVALGLPQGAETHPAADVQLPEGLRIVL